MKKKEPVGDSDELPAEVIEGLAASTADGLQVSLSVTLIISDIEGEYAKTGLLSYWNFVITIE